MITKTKLALAAAIALTSASAALADNAPYTAEKEAYLKFPAAPVPTYSEQAIQYQAAPRGYAGQLIEGRNVGVARDNVEQNAEGRWERASD